MEGRGVWRIDPPPARPGCLGGGFLEGGCLEGGCLESLEAASIEAASLEAASVEAASLEEASTEAARAGGERVDPRHTPNLHTIASPELVFGGGSLFPYWDCRVGTPLSKIEKVNFAYGSVKKN